MVTDAKPAAITIRGLKKSYGTQLVLDDIDLHVPAGTVFALLGPNGAGKTTMVQILSTLIRPDAGSVQIEGHDLSTAPQAVRGVIGVTGQFSAVDNLLTGRENMMLMAALHHLDGDAAKARSEELLGQFDLLDAAAKPASTYSGGMRRRLDLAMTLVGKPKVIFLDEPSAGLDPRSRRDLWQIVRELVAGGVTIFLTTQYLDEADQLADQIAILDGGRLVIQGTPVELKRQAPGGHVRLQFSNLAALEIAGRTLGRSSRDDDELALRVLSDGDLASLRSLLKDIDQASIDVEGLTVHAPNLDDVFLALTERQKAS